jgi:serine/threonine-protein kinase
MFLDEARLAARLNHPNVVQTNEVGQDGNSYFIAMEYLEGQTFRRILSRLGRGADAPLHVGMQLRVLVDALHGLHYAHDLADFDGTPLHVVHRDVSPDNIFVTYTGQVKVVDFGIAKALGSTSKTQTGMIKGKVSYMSPEQACGEAVDRRSDVFSLGVILWEVSTGQRLFSGMPDIAVMHRLTSNNIPRPGTVHGAVDERLEAIVMKAMAYDPAERHQSAGELAKALEALLWEWGDESSCRDVGALAADRFAEDRERVRALIERQVHVIQAAPTAEADRLPLLQLEQTVSSGASAVAGAASAAEPATELTASSTVMTPAMAPPATRRAPKGLVLGVLAASAILGGGAAFFILSGSAESGGSAAPSSAPSPAETVTVRIESEPSGAKVECGDREQGSTPVDLPVAVGDEIDCTVRLEGYDTEHIGPRKVTAAFEKTVSLRPVASAEPSSAPSGTSKTAPPPLTAGRQPPPPTTATPTAPPKTGGGDIRLER